MFKMIKLLLSGCVMLVALATPAKEINMLFIGNSFTARHNIPMLVKTVFEEGQSGLKVNVQKIIYGGQDMFRHSTYYFSQSFIEQSTITDAEIKQRIKTMENFLKSKTPPNEEEYNYFFKKISTWGAKQGRRVEPFKKIQGLIKIAIKRHKDLLKNNKRIKWDYVVLQSWQDVHQSLDEGYAKYAMNLVKPAEKAGAKVILYITAPNIQNKQPVKAPLLQERVDREIKLAREFSKKINAYAVVPVPLALNMIQQGGTDLKFCYVNDFHPNQYTAFLVANMFYAAFFRKSPVGLKFNSVTENKLKNGKDPDGGDKTVVFKPEVQKYLQKIAFEAVRKFYKK